MGLWEDVRFAGRLLLKDKWFTLVAAVALALGIGVNATVFTFVNAVLIRGVPMPDADRVMAMGSTDRVRNRNQGVSYLDFRDWRDTARTFDLLSIYTGNIANLSDEGQPPERYSGATCRRDRVPHHGPATGARPRTSLRTTIGPARLRWR